MAMQTQVETPQETRPKIVCEHAEVGVVLVHGIGNQDEAHTRDCYGGAIARMWKDFGRNPGYSEHRCTHEHIHLVRPDGSHAAVVDEAYWQPIAGHTPHRGKLALWLFVVAPWVLIHTGMRPLRTTADQSVLRVIWLLSLWVLRIIFVPLWLGPVIALALVAMLVLSIGAALNCEAADAKLAILGDAYRYTRGGRAATTYADVVATKADELGAMTDRLLVVGHSQGGAVTYDAIAGGPAHPDVCAREKHWPTARTRVITLGSGYKRLSMLRMMIATRGRRLATAVGSVGLLASSVVSMCLVYLGDEADGEVAAGLIYMTAALVGVVLWRLSMVNGKQIGDAVADKEVTWLDIWASLDLVPDGGIAHSGIAHIEVNNSHSLIKDHTTYHQNASQVVSRIVNAIDHRRLATQRDVVAEMCKIRRRRYRTWTVTRFARVTVTAGLVSVYRPVCKRRAAAEFAGNVDAVRPSLRLPEVRMPSMRIRKRAAVTF